MSDQAGRREAIKAYKERMEVGGLYRIVNTKTGWATQLMATPNLEGQKNRFEFSKRTGSPLDSTLRDEWAKHGPDAFQFEEVERLTQKPGQSPADFREELSTLLKLYRQKD